jgi:hypothetical protein
MNLIMMMFLDADVTVHHHDHCDRHGHGATDHWNGTSRKLFNDIRAMTPRVGHGVAAATNTTPSTVPRRRARLH